MKLKVKKPRLDEKVQKAAGVKKAQAKKRATYPDEYKDEIPAKMIRLSDTKSLVFSVKRQGDDGLPAIDIREFIETERYSGFTKQGIRFDCEFLETVMKVLDTVDTELREKGI
mgnify:CR=1 FL=1